MAWPPPARPTNKTNATPQQDDHAAEHNAVGLAINDIVAKVSATTRHPPRAVFAAGLDKPITSGTTCATLTVPADAVGGMLVLLTYHCLVDISAGGPFDLQLRAANTGSPVILAQWRISGTGSKLADGQYPLYIAAPYSAFVVDVIAGPVPGGTTATVYGNPLFQYLSAVIMQGQP